MPSGNTVLKEQKQIVIPRKRSSNLSNADNGQFIQMYAVPASSYMASKRVNNKKGCLSLEKAAKFGGGCCATLLKTMCDCLPHLQVYTDFIPGLIDYLL